MNRFEHASPTTTAEAIALLAEKPGESMALAGGTDLLALMKDEIVRPRRVVSLARIEELRGIEEGRRSLTIGALTTVDELLADERVRKDHAALAQAADGIRSPQLRTVGTVGGELCQWPRCWYFRMGFDLLAERAATVRINRFPHAPTPAIPSCFIRRRSLPNQRTA